MNNEVTDVVDRLRASSKFALMDAARVTVVEAAGVIEKLRRRLHLADAAIRSESTLLLTSEEKSAIETVLETGLLGSAEDARALRGLIERTEQ